MYEVINHTKSYAICQCEDGFYDTNGGFYPLLLNFQEKYLNKVYYFVLERNADEIILHIFKTEINVTDFQIKFTEMESGCHILKNGRITTKGSDTGTDTKLLLLNAKNPEVLFSFINILLKQRRNYSELLSFFKYCYQLDKTREISQVYILMYDMLLKGCSSIVDVFVRQDMFNMLICLLQWHKQNRGTTLSTYRQLIKVLKEMEKLSVTAYGPDKVSPFKISSSVIDNVVQLLCQYGKENTTAFVQFLEVILQLNEKSTAFYERKDSLSIACDAIELLVDIKRQFPETRFSHNVNYIFKQMFRTYEYHLTAEGVIVILNIWRDYLKMMDEGDSIYPDHVKRSHDLVQKTYLTRLSEHQKELFKQAVDEYRDLEYQDEKYHVTVPLSSDELTAVGKALNICVGSYADAVSEKRTQILWVYGDGQYPVVVLQVKNHELKQAKTESNNLPSPTEDEFIKKWCLEKDIKIVSY